MEELTPEIVHVAYKLFLGRKPESAAVITSALDYGTLDALRSAFLTSPEFAGVLQSLGWSTAGTRPLRLVPIGAPPITVEWQADAVTSATLLAHVRATWTRLGRERPHWSVLSAQAFTPEEIGGNEPAFYNSGEADLSNLIAILNRNSVGEFGKARLVEFGCGIGRVTPYLAKAFQHVDACDVSITHMDMARAAAARAGARNVAFHLVEDDTFGMSSPFDIWFSRIVLQHNAPPIIAMILKKALTMLSPGGTAVFQVPTYATRYAFRVADYLRSLDQSNSIEMHVLPQPIVLMIARECGCQPLEILEDMSAGPSSDWNSTTFVLRKQDQNTALCERQTHIFQAENTA